MSRKLLPVHDQDERDDGDDGEENEQTQKKPDLPLMRRRRAGATLVFCPGHLLILRAASSTRKPDF
jgi:hypothetical protein